MIKAFHNVLSYKKEEIYALHQSKLQYNFTNRPGDDGDIDDDMFDENVDFNSADCKSVEEIQTVSSVIKNIKLTLLDYQPPKQPGKESSESSFENSFEADYDIIDEEVFKPAMIARRVSINDQLQFSSEALVISL